MGGHDPYSSSKGCAELVTAAYRNAFFDANTFAQHRVAVASARAGNVIGGGDWAKDRLIPDILAAFERSEPALIRNPQATRPWQHVLEPLRGYLTLAERLHDAGSAYADGWNFGPLADDARPVQWIAERMAQKWGGGAAWTTDGGNHPHEANYLKLDISKAAQQLHWTPIIRLEQALDWIVDWALARNAGADIRALTLAQISAYDALASEAG
jgi:CDP-glucose 4,6-dehydratase